MSGSWAAASFPRVPTRFSRQRLRTGLQVGLIAAAATAGVAFGYGRRERGGFRPFAAVGRHLSGGSFRTGALADFLSTMLGLAFHVALIVAWGVLFALIAARLRGWLRVLAACAVGAVAYAVHAALPPLLRPGYDVMALRPQIAVHIALALALAVGMRIAEPSRHD